MATVAKQPENPQIEFVHYALEIVNICILNKELRDFVLTHEIPSLVRLHAKKEDQEKNWVEYLRMLETNDQIKSIKKMHQKVKRMRKELEFWQKSKQVKTAQVEEGEKV